VVLGPPLFAGRRADEGALLGEIAEALHAARARAQVLAGVRPWR
jgi:hypothetical protein